MTCGMTKASRILHLAAEERFNELSPVEQARVFVDSNDRERLRLVELSHKPRELVSQIPAVEIWFTIKRLTPHDSLDLIRYTTPEQLQVILDIELWKKDRLDQSMMCEWAGIIAACGIEKVMEWFSKCDFDQIIWFFRENVVVYKREEKDIDPMDAVDWPREEAPITYEGIFYFQVLNQKYDGLIRHLLEIVAKHDRKIYEAICEACIWDISSVREEEAYEVRERRLAEHGFPTFDEAISIYSPLSPARFKTIKKRQRPSKTEIAPKYPLAVMGDKILFINRVMGELGELAEGEFLKELAVIANKIQIADGGEINPEGLGDALVKAIGYSNIGLETLSGGDLKTAVSLVEEYWLMNIFQVGLGEVMKLAGEAKKFFDKSRLDVLPEEEKIFVENLLLKRPLYFTGENPYSKKDLRDFLSTAEIDSARSRLWTILKK